MRNSKGIGYIVNAVAAVLGIIGVICYFLSGDDRSGMTETFVSALVYVPFILAVVCSLIGLFYSNSLIKIAAFALYFFSLATWIMTQAGYIVNVFMGLDGNSFSFAYIVTFISLIACMVLSIVSGATSKKKAQKAA